jgi:hypothetical protein
LAAPKIIAQLFQNADADEMIIHKGKKLHPMLGTFLLSMAIT